MFTLTQKEYLNFKKNYQSIVEGTNIKHKGSYYNVIGDWAGVGLHYIFQIKKK